MALLSELMPLYEKAFDDVCVYLKDICSSVIEKTEKDIGHPMSSEERNLAISFTVWFAFFKALEK